MYIYVCMYSGMVNDKQKPTTTTVFLVPQEGMTKSGSDNQRRHIQGRERRDPQH